MCHGACNTCGCAFEECECAERYEIDIDAIEVLHDPVTGMTTQSTEPTMEVPRVYLV